MVSRGSDQLDAVVQNLDATADNLDFDAIDSAYQAQLDQQDREYALFCLGSARSARPTNGRIDLGNPGLGQTQPRIT